MMRVKLVVSDFHLGTGQRQADGSLNPIEDFLLDDRFIEFIEYHATGDYTTAEVELVINGDFFNMLQGEVDGVVPSDVTETIARRQLEAIFAGHARLFDSLRAFAEQPGKKLTFILGNHDAGLVFPAAKELLRQRLGEQIQIHNRSYVFDDVHVEHGDRYEPAHRVDPKLPILSKGLAQGVVNLPWASYFFIHFVRKIKARRAYIDKVKPFRHYLTWAALYDFRFFLVMMARLIGFVFWTAAFGRVGHKRFGFRSLLMLVEQARGDAEARAARQLLKVGKANIVIFGHTHHPIYRQWLPGREYLNTGCWNGITHLDIERYGFQVQLAYAQLEWNGRRWLAALRRWKGRTRPYEDFLA
ncbi:MAG: hypothetical protein C4523_00195 [Myxococcales bacterium]|nr:MAG: hypothetical protein C4523_00195 [Myxococcales bacterium]